MKRPLYISILAVILPVVSFAEPRNAGKSDNPRLDTVEKCRAYREAWNASAQEDVKTLTVRQLIDRSEQMINCPTRVDVDPLKEGTSAAKAVDEVIRYSSYAILSSAYRQEVIARLTAFLETKRLSRVFILEDESSHSTK
jgi:hypothetical protein